MNNFLRGPADFRRAFIQFMKDFVISFILIVILFAFQAFTTGFSFADFKAYFFPILFIYMITASLKFISPENQPHKWGFMWNDWKWKYLFLFGACYATLIDILRRTPDLLKLMELTGYYDKAAAGLFIGIWSLTINELLKDLIKKTKNKTK